MINVNIEEFLSKFKKEYDFLYDNNDNVAGYREAVASFDKMVRENQSFGKFVGQFVKYRGDYISSDREAGAFMFTMESMGLL